MRRWLSIITLMFGVFTLSATEIQERQFDAGKIADYQKQPAFNYTQDKASGSFVSMVLAYLRSKLAPLFDALALQWVTPVFFKILLFAGIIVVILVLLRLKYGAALSKKSRGFDSAVIAYAGGEKQDYEKLLQESLQDKQLKLAVRYLFLTTLGMLEQQKIIEITKWKAPYDYLKDLPEGKRNLFKQLTDLFENTWYGNYMPDNDAVTQGLQWYHQLENA